MSGTPLRFIIQDHKTEHPHYDLRLEVNGAPISWILPKGVPTAKGEKRLAIEDKEEKPVPASPRSLIKDGYGAGEAEVRDSGTYEITKKATSKIEFEAKGEKLYGRFSLLLPSWGRWCKKRLWVLIKL